MSTPKRALLVLVAFFAFCVPQVSFAASPSISELEKLLRDLTEQLEQLLAQRSNEPAMITLSSPEKNDFFEYGDRMKVSWRAENVPKRSEVCITLVEEYSSGVAEPFGSRDGCEKAKNGTDSVTARIDSDLDSGNYLLRAQLRTWGGWLLTDDLVSPVVIGDEEDLDEDEDEDDGDENDLDYEMVSRAYDEGDSIPEGADVSNMFLRVENEGNDDVRIYPDTDCEVYYEIRRQGSDSLVYSSKNDDECRTYRSASDGASYTIEDDETVELDVSHDEDDYHLSPGEYRLVGYLAGYGSDSFRFEVSDQNGNSLGDLKIYVDENRVVDRDDRARVEADAECSSVATANPGKAIRCEWDGTVIYERAAGEARGTYIGYKNNVEFIRVENVTKAEAIANCKTSIKASPGKIFKCTWNGAVVHEGVVYNVTVKSPNSGTYVAGAPIAVSWTSTSGFPAGTTLCASIVSGTSAWLVGTDCVKSPKANGTITGTVPANLAGSYTLTVEAVSAGKNIAKDNADAAIVITKAQTSFLNGMLGRLMAGVGQVLGAATSVTLTRDLTLGSRGADVTALQKWLYREGYMTAADTGEFGMETMLGVMSVQLKYKITPASGYVGPITRAKINELMAATPALSSTNLSFAADDADVNESRLIEGDTHDSTEDVEIFSFKATAGQGSDIILESLPVTFAFTGVSKLADMFSRLSLSADGDNLIDVTPTGTSKTVVFSGLDHGIEAGETMTFSIFADLKPLIGAFGNGGTFRLNFGETQTDSAHFLATNEAGVKLSDAQVMGGASAGEFLVSDSGILASFISASEAVISNPDGTSQGTFGIKFEVTAIGSDVYIARSGGQTSLGGVLYRVIGTPANGTQATSALDSSADETGSDFVIDEGDSEEFELTVVLTPTLSGTYGVAVEKLLYRTTPGGTLSGVTPEDFETDEVALTAPGGPPSCSITAAPVQSVEGTPVTLSWTSKNATSAFLGLGIGTVPVNGSRKVTLASGEPKVAELTVTNSKGVKAYCNAQFVVGPPIGPGVSYEASTLKSTSPTPVIRGLATAATPRFYLTGKQGDGSNSFKSSAVTPSNGKWSVRLPTLYNGMYKMSAVTADGKFLGGADLVIHASTTVPAVNYRAIVNKVLAEEASGLTEAEALARCMTIVNADRTKSVRCMWGSKTIYDKAGIAKYEAFLDGATLISKEGATKEGALKNCKAQAAKYPTKAVRCTWNGEVIYDEPALGSSTASSTALYRAPSQFMSLLAGVGTVLTEIPKNFLNIFRFE